MKNKKLLSYVLAAAMVSTVGIAAGCTPDKGGEGGNGDTPVKLSAPAITLTGNTITWNAVEHADGYNVYEGTTSVSTQTACSYTISQTAPGTYSYTVVATSTDEKYTSSDKSNAVEYTVEGTVADTSTKLTGKVYVVGDSTVCSFSSTERYMPRYGYGTQLYNYINCDPSQIVNLAASGRSSYSFMTDSASNYSRLTSEISSGDYLIIGFGHNDQKDDIYTNPNLASDDASLLDNIKGHYASFKYTLKHFYIDVALEAGATPILCTPIVRASSSSDYSGKNGHVVATSDGEAYPGGDYPKAIRELAEECGINCVDLTALTKADYTAIGYTEATKYHSYSGATYDTDGVTVIPTGVDNTHTNYYGAKMNAYYVASELLKTDNPLANHIRTNIVKPEYEDNREACIYSGYNITGYTAFNPETDKSSKYNITAENWYGTAFGSISLGSVIVEQDGDTFTVGTTGGSGKITSSGDGIAAVFMQLGSDDNFKIEADVNIVTYGTTTQTGFGIMLRDDMFIDNKDTIPTSNYVVAGCYGVDSAANMNFYRVNNSLKASGQVGKLDLTVTHKLTLERSGTTVIAKIDGYTYTSDRDFELKAVDSEYMYLCLFATRDTKVIFSNIVYTYNGTSVA